MIEKNDYSRNDMDGRNMFSCNKCHYEANKEGVIKKHVKQKHAGKPGRQGEDVDDIISVEDMFEDKTSSIQIDQDSIDRLIEECSKDLLEDDENDWLFDEEEEEAVDDNIAEPINSMANQLKEMEAKYNIEKENNKFLQKRMNCLEEKTR